MQTKTIISAAVAASISLSAQAQLTFEPIVVTATRTEFRDSEAPYASEVHRRSDIAGSGVGTLYDYLERHSSLNVTPSFGNPFAQKLDMRGYGLGDGHQNIVVTLNGRRLNNIDMGPQLLGAIPLASIERIEIIKGSGSVVHGDGATAGAIHIITREQDGASLMLGGGSHGQLFSNLSAGLQTERASLNMSAENYSHDGFRAEDPSGQRDTADANNLQARLKFYANDRVELRLDKGVSRLGSTYGDSLTLAQFEQDPAQYGGNGWSPDYNGQEIEADTTSLGVTADLQANLSLVFDHHIEDQYSAYASGWASDYDSRTSDLALHYQGGALSLVTGLQYSDGKRKQIGSETGKENSAYYLQGHYRLQSSILSVGARRESVNYRHAPDSAPALEDEHKLSAWDLGINQSINEQTNVFANYNAAFQAPDIDRFFSNGNFNAFIVPARSRTLNLGLNHDSAKNRLRLTLFHSQLENEIYYYNSGDWSTSYNTNIDASYKYGLELQEHYRFNDKLSGTVNYSWVRAIIEHEDEAAGAYNGKTLPGVSEHSVILGLNYAPTQASTLTLNHNWRSEAYAANDFANSFSQKQAAYQSTDIGYGHKLDRFELFARVDNLFDQANGLWIRDDAIYPVNFTRSWRVGIRGEF
jgi:iron complex outermembrane receptor protein